MRLAVVLVGAAACGRVEFTSRADAASGSVVDTDVSSDPVGWWKLDEGTGTTAADSSGYGHPGTLSAGLSWGAGPRGPVLFIPDGATDEQVDLGDPALFHRMGSMTLAGWVSFSSFNAAAADDVILSRDDIDHPGGRGWALKGSGDCGGLESFVFQISDGLDFMQRCSVTRPSLNTWYHVAGAYDASMQTLDIYVDGRPDNDVLMGIVPAAQYVPTSPVHTQIANANPFSSVTTGGASMLHGMLSDIRLYDRALTASEIMQVVTP